MTEWDLQKKGYVRAVADPGTGGSRFSTPTDVTTPVSQSDLATTIGSQGAVYELSDGADKGVKLTWATPVGETQPTWCWWLYPQSKYEGV